MLASSGSGMHSQETRQYYDLPPHQVIRADGNIAPIGGHANSK